MITADELQSFDLLIWLGTGQLAASRCGCSQPTIQRDIKLLEAWAGEIAVDAAELLKTIPGFEKLGTSETLIDEVATALCELLLKPLNYGEEALLCQAIDHHLHSS